MCTGTIVVSPGAAFTFEIKMQIKIMSVNIFFIKQIYKKNTVVHSVIVLKPRFRIRNLNEMNLYFIVVKNLIGNLG